MVLGWGDEVGETEGCMEHWAAEEAGVGYWVHKVAQVVVALAPWVAQVEEGMVEELGWWEEGVKEGS